MPNGKQAVCQLLAKHEAVLPIDLGDQVSRQQTSSKDNFACLNDKICC